jgi:CRP-like cAMP-binding protein
MSLCSVKKGDFIFKQNTIGNFFYVIKTGKVDLFINDNHIKIMQDGTCFGELALLHGATRSGTIKANSNCQLWVLERKYFKQIIEQVRGINHQETISFINTIPLFKFINEDQKKKLSSNLIKENYEAGEIIFKEGERPRCLFIINKGLVEYFSSEEDKYSNILTVGDCFGMRPVLLNDYQILTAKAKIKCEIFSISLLGLREVFGENYFEPLLLNFIKSVFYSSERLNKFDFNLINDIYSCFELIEVEKDQIFSNRHLNNKIIINLEGCLCVILFFYFRTNHMKLY